MRNSTFFLIIVTLLFTSCSKDDDQNTAPDQETVILSFGTALNDMVSGKLETKQQTGNIPACSDELPFYVELILSQDGNEVVGSTGNPLRIQVNPSPYDYDGDGEEEYFTEESSSLELLPGEYTLEYFQVLDENENTIWITPVSGTSGFSDFVDAPLPLDLQLVAGTKKYVPVEVLCYDDRFVNQYGYQFFDIESKELIKFCIFGNYCLEDGRHVEATRYSVDVWNYSGDVSNPKGTSLHADVENVISVTDYDDHSVSSAEPLCLPLPDRDGTDEYYFEITLLEFNYETEERIIRSGVITDEDVRSLYTADDSMDYYHFRVGNCNLEDSPAFFEDPGNGVDPDPNLDSDRDGVPNIDDNCPYQYNPNQFGGTPDYYGEEACFTPCTLFTDEEDFLRIASGTSLDFQTIQHNWGRVGLRPIGSGNRVGSANVELVGSKLVVGISIDHAEYLADHLIEVKDDHDSEIICELVFEEFIEGGTDGFFDYYSIVEIDVPPGFSAPYYVRITGNLYDIF